MRRLALVAAVMMMGVGSSLAQGAPTNRAFLTDYSRMPNFLVDKACKAYGRGSLILEKSCLQSEQTAYDVLKPRWSDIPDSVKKRCYEEVMPYYFEAPYQEPDRFGFTMLLGCIAPTMDAEGVSSQGKFRP